MAKMIKRFVLSILILGIALTSFIFYKGYKEYEIAITNNDMQTLVSSMQNQEHFMSLDALPPLLIDATVVTEDSRYFMRDSVLDLEAVMRAVKTNIRRRAFVEGGSTIPQQVSKNLYFDQSTTLTRKIAEYFVTRDLLATYSKEEILALYLNMNYYGDGFYGIYDASMGYFGVQPLDMNEGQTTLVAGLPQAPSYYQLSTGYTEAKARQKHVLHRLYNEHKIEEADVERIYTMHDYGGKNETKND